MEKSGEGKLLEGDGGEKLMKECRRDSELRERLGRQQSSGGNRKKKRFKPQRTQQEVGKEGKEEKK